MLERITDITSLTSERTFILDSLKKKGELNTEVHFIDKKTFLSNRLNERILGLYRKFDSKKVLIADTELIENFRKKNKIIPSFYEAGPRSKLLFDPQTVRVAIVTTGGLAPGLHCVIHSIVKRHRDTYGAAQGKIFGVYNSFRGLCDMASNTIELDSTITEEWLDQGGSKLGIVRYYHNTEGSEHQGKKVIEVLASEITKNLESNRIDILYIIGGDGSLKTAHEIAIRNPKRSIIGIPKTMDNDVLWVWQSFGFDTAVEQATRVINTLRSEAEATRRICLIELFGAESGFVAANSTLASGHVDAVLIPEVFKALDNKQVKKYLDDIIEHIEKRVGDEDLNHHNPHALIVVAEGVGTILENNNVKIDGKRVTKKNFLNSFQLYIEKKVKDAHGSYMPVFPNQPRHNIRAVPANAHDQIYCERLGALAVDNALAGYTDCMISLWLTEFVLVPLTLVQLGKKSVPIKGMFWKQVVNSTGQPLSAAE
ncbi:MAG: 6-phosphofructokinase [Ignavibacteriae bacterium]|nr:6-phosphofructokinase [Ignavibacteriota bacterium]